MRPTSPQPHGGGGERHEGGAIPHGTRFREHRPRCSSLNQSRPKTSFRRNGFEAGDPCSMRVGTSELELTAMFYRMSLYAVAALILLPWTAVAQTGRVAVAKPALAAPAAH